MLHLQRVFLNSDLSNVLMLLCLKIASLLMINRLHKLESTIELIKKNVALKNFVHLRSDQYA